MKASVIDSFVFIVFASIILIILINLFNNLDSQVVSSFGENASVSSVFENVSANETLKESNETAEKIKDIMTSMNSDNLLEKISGTIDLFSFAVFQVASALFSSIMFVPKFLMSILYAPYSPIRYVIPEWVTFYVLSGATMVIIVRFVLWLLNRGRL